MTTAEKHCKVCDRPYERYSDHVLGNEHLRALKARRPHPAWPGPGSHTCITCDREVVADAISVRGWKHAA